MEESQAFYEGIRHFFTYKYLMTSVVIKIAAVSFVYEEGFLICQK
jgi:hypothetical protein